VVSAVSDASKKTVIDLIAPQDRRPGLYPVGRLDGDTEGLLLLTDNGTHVSYAKLIVLLL
jgi:16S rRNA pseudouridine516 synthase